MDLRLKETPFEINGKTYLLRCNMNVLADVQEAFEGDFKAALDPKSSIKAVHQFLAAMLNDYADEMGWPDRFNARQLGRILSCSPSIMKQRNSLVMDLVASALQSGEEEPELSKN